MSKKKYAAVVMAYREREGVGIHITIDTKDDKDLEDLAWELVQSIQKHHPEVLKNLVARIIRVGTAKGAVGLIKTAMDKHLNLP